MKKLKEKYYENKRDELGLNSIERLMKYLPASSPLMKRNVTYAHLDFEKIATAIAKKEPFAIISGLSPTGPLHFGHKAIFDELLWFQKNFGAEIYIPITNDEAYVVNKMDSLKDSLKCAYEEVIPGIIAFGFDPKKTKLFVDSDYKDIYNVAMQVSKNLSLRVVKRTFGFEEEIDNPGALFYRGAIQLSQIILPQLKEFGGPKPTLVLAGIDQHPYILLSRDVAKKMGLIEPSSIYIKFLNSLAGPQNKMSTSDPNSCIYLTDKPEVAEKKIDQAFTGGSPLAEKQKQKGGIPEACSIFSLLKYHFLDDKSFQESYLACSKGKVLCNGCKKGAKKMILEYLSEYQKRFEKAKGQMDEFLLKTPIKSILE